MEKLKHEEKVRDGQVYRILSMYDRLRNGEHIVKRDEAMRFQISEKSIQRDIQAIREFLEVEQTNEYLDYDRTKRAYVLNTTSPSWLSNEDIFAMLKVLIESRAFSKNEMYRLIDKLTALAKKDEQQTIEKMMLNEKHLYVELQHKKQLIQTLWQLSETIQHKHVITIDYKREFDEQSRKHELKPVGIMFSEFYFYLIAYSAKKDFGYPTIYRIDRIERFYETYATFNIPYKERFQEGEFRKRVQFMYTGELMTVRFKFTGISPQAVLDRLPTARIIKKEERSFIFEAEVFGDGIKIWLLSQGEYVEVLKPESLRQEMMQKLKKSYVQYDE